MKIKSEWIIIGIMGIALAFIYFKKSQRPVVQHVIEEPLEKIPEANYDDLLGMSASGLNEPEFPAWSYIDFNDPSRLVPEMELGEF